MTVLTKTTWWTRMQTSDLSKRRFLALGGSSALVALAGRPALAISTSQASGLVQNVVTQVLALVNSGQSQQAVLTGFERIFAANADVQTIARTVMGRPWRTATDAQKSAFIQAYQDYIGSIYGNQFREYRGSTVTLGGVKDQGQKGVLVNSTVKVPGQAPFAIDWQVIDRGGQPKLFDLYIEGVSMLITGRTEIASILEASGGNIDRMIATLQRGG